MPEPFDRIDVKLSTGEVALAWATREALLNRLGAHGLVAETDIARGIAKAFDDVGASRPVTFTLEQKTYLLRLLELWSLEIGGYDDMPAGLFALRNALSDDLAEAEQRTD